MQSTQTHLLSRLLKRVLSATFVSTSLSFSRVMMEVYLQHEQKVGAERLLATPPCMELLEDAEGQRVQS